MCTVKQTINPTLKIKITAGIADNLIPNNVIAPKICTNDAITLITTNSAAQADSNNIDTSTKAATNEQHNMNANDERNVMYCSQKINGMPV